MNKLQEGRKLLESLSCVFEKEQGMETDFEGDFLYVAFREKDPERCFLLTFHPSTHEIWVSSPHSGAHHFSYDSGREDWRHTRQGIPLFDFLRKEFMAYADVDVSFDSVA